MASTKRIKSRKSPAVNYEGRAEKIRKFRSLPFNNRSKFTTKQKQFISALWPEYRYLTPRNLRRVGKKTADKLKACGFRVEEKGAIIEKSFQARGKPLAGARLYVRKSGTITQTVGARKDYVIPLLGDDRALVQFDPEYHVKRLLSREGIKEKRKFYFLVVDGQTWGKYKEKGGRLTISGIAIKLRSFMAKNPKAYKKAHIAIKVVTFHEKKKRAKK